MKNLIILIFTLALTHSLHAQITVDPNNGNVGIKDSTPEEALTIAGNTSSNNFGSNYFMFNNQYSGTLSSSIDKNGIRWQVPNQSGFGDDSIRYYQLYNYGQDKLFFDNDADYSNGAHLTITRDGNIGIGNTNPLNPLQVDGDALFNSSAGYLKFGLPTGNGWGYSTTGGGSTLNMNSYTNTSTEAGTVTRVTYKNDGTNGFGTSSPEKVLHANSAASGGALRLTRTGTSCIMDAGAEMDEAFIGTTSNHDFIILTNNVLRLEVRNDGNVGIGVANPTFPLQVSGDAYISGDLTVASDLCFKKEIEPIQNALSIVGQLNPVQYYYRTDEFPSMKFSNRKKMGLIAQDLENVLPELVFDAGEVEKSNGSTLNTKSVNYQELIPLLIKSIQELQEKVSEKDAELDLLNQKLERLILLEKEIDMIKEMLNEKEWKKEANIKG